MHILRRVRRLRLCPAGAGLWVPSALLALALLLVVPAPAFAHDALEGSAPTSGATVTAVPDEVRLDFGEQPLGVGAEVRVTDPSGTSWSDGAPQVVDRSVHQRLRSGGPAGTYTVVWRVVSADSHPVEGTFTFSVAPGASGSTTPAGAPAASTSPAAGAGIQASQPGSAQTPPAAPAAQGEPFPWAVLVFALVAIGLLIALGVGARRRLARGEDPGPGSEA
jgi:methionine-rich copper-binding protein CopC